MGNGNGEWGMGMGNGNGEWGMGMASKGKSSILVVLLQWKYLKVNKSRKQFMMSSIIPKNERWDNFM